MTTTQTTPATTVTPTRSRREVGSYVGVTNADSEIGRYVDVEQPTTTLRQQISAFVRSLREPTPASRRVSGHGLLR